MLPKDAEQKSEQFSLSLAQTIDSIRKSDAFRSYPSEEKLALMVVVQALADAISVPKEAYRSFREMEEFFLYKVDAMRFIFDDAYGKNRDNMGISEFLALCPSDFCVSKEGLRKALAPLQESIAELKSIASVFVKLGQGTREDITMFLEVASAEERQAFTRFPQFFVQADRKKEAVDPRAIVEDFERLRMETPEKVSSVASQREEGKTPWKNAPLERFFKDFLEENNREAGETSGASSGGSSRRMVRQDAQTESKKPFVKAVYTVARRLFQDFDDELARAHAMDGINTQSPQSSLAEPKKTAFRR